MRIKPPGTDAADTSNIGESQGNSGSVDGESPFRRLLDAAKPQASSTHSVGPTSGGESVAPDDAVVSGEALSAAPDTVVQRVVDEALSSPLTRLLGPRGREELEVLIQRMLEDDPTLSALAADLKRGSR